LSPVKSGAGCIPLSQSKLIRRLPRILTLDDSTTTGHYTNFNLVFKATRRVCHRALTCYHSVIYAKNFGSILY
jgi:hypothetical protein